MSKLTEAAQSIQSALGEVKFNEDLSLNVEGLDANAIYRERAGVTDEQLDKIAETTSAITEALTDKVGRAMIGKFKEDAELNNLAFEHESRITGFGVDMVRPDKDTKATRANISARVSYRKLDSTIDAIDNLCGLWDE